MYEFILNFQDGLKKKRGTYGKKGKKSMLLHFRLYLMSYRIGKVRLLLGRKMSLF
ncbi:hypothetical protein SDC9_147369 [bioreactor metagenome]|uniref:Uncharacterized protein n=1 Tax=bioreactor metagenome TaxID=1076179 RepID=A0A645EDN2_9ZZZZ